MEFQTFMSAFDTVIRNTLLEQQLFTQIFASKLFHVSNTIAKSLQVRNTICNSLITKFTTSWQI